MKDNALARLDKINWSPYLVKIILLLALGLFFEYYDIFITGYIAPSLLKSSIFNNSTLGLMGLNDIALFVSCMFLGMWCGTLLLGYIADKYGRKSIFTWSLVWYSLCTFIMAFQTTKFGFNLWRFLASIGLGVEMVTITSYISELVPSKYRGRASAIAMVIAFMAVPVVALLSWLLSTHTYYGIEGFRFVIIIGSIGAIIVWFIRLGIPESPRWLYTHGKQEQAISIIKSLEQKTNTTYLASEELLDVLPEQLKTYSDIFKPPLIKSTMILMIFHILQTIGYYGFATWGPLILLSKGITITKSLQYSFIIAIANPIAPMLYSLFADHIQRKRQMVVIPLLVALFGILFALQTTSIWIITFGVCLTLSINFLSCTFLIYQTELYPTRIRSTAVGFVYSWSRLSAVFSGFIIAFIIHSFNTITLFIFIAACMLIISVIVLFYGRNTNDTQLEKIN
ncbi:MAG TPA: MFS transporter [Aquella sp.]|nr:MFS transporter [Aquella sp.]